MKGEKTMNNNTKLEIAIEIMAAKIAEASKKGLTEEDDEMKKLLKERMQMYREDEHILDKIINEYGKQLRNKQEEDLER